MITRGYWKFTVGLLLTLGMSAQAGVNLKNGNFYIAYTDIVVPGAGKKLEITRTYNSKSTQVGWFGFGWGSKFETQLQTSADGCAVIREHGAGGKTRFCPKRLVDGGAAAQKIVSAMRKKTTLSENAAKSLVKKLTNNAELRHAYARNFGVKTQLAAGTILYSNQRGMQKLHKLKDGFKRSYSNGTQEFFNNEGKLSKVKEKDGYTITLDYKNKKLFKIADNRAKQIFFDWYSNGRVKSLWSAGDKKAEYKYKNVDLVYSKDVQGNAYGFDYDRNHNMVRIDYSPNSKKGGDDVMMMKYQPKTYFITQITDRNGDMTTYKYGSNPKKPRDHYWTIVGKKGFGGKMIKNRYEYEIKAKPDGQRYTYRIKTVINGVNTETIYSECCSLPIKIARGKHVTNFEYNEDGLLTKKTSTKGDFVQIEYDKRHKKIAKVRNNQGVTKFKYDKKGNLVKAVNKTKVVSLKYDYKGKITSMSDTNIKTKSKRILNFKYNAIGKPVEISMKDTGKIRVKYDNYGEIKQVDSKQGHKMALQVTQAFQNLLSIVKPAGVNLNM
jgi:YD repeat-containing protein